MSGYAWSDVEISRVDKALELGIGPLTALRFFPNRTHQALHSKFAWRRPVVGVKGKAGRPPRNSSDAIRELAYFCAPRGKFEVSTALVPEPKAYTADTDEAHCSRDLLRRQLQTGQHHLSNDRFYAACESVGLPVSIAA